MRRWELAIGLVIAVLAATAAYGDYHTSPAQTLSKVDRQLQTAIEHAKNASGANTLSGAVQHLGHTLNCIEGTKGKNFNAAWGHVCQGQGDGILTDIKGARNAAAVALVLDAADELAAAGVKAKDLAAVQVAARGVAVLLGVVMDTIK